MNLEQTKHTLDAIRSEADKIAHIVDALASGPVGDLVKMIPEAGPIIQAIVLGLDALDDAIDALDASLDASLFGVPSAGPVTTILGK